MCYVSRAIVMATYRSHKPKLLVRVRGPLMSETHAHLVSCPRIGDVLIPVYMYTIIKCDYCKKYKNSKDAYSHQTGMSCGAAP